MTALATIDSASTLVVPAPTHIRPTRLQDVRPRDRIAFRGYPPAPVPMPDPDETPWATPISADLPDPPTWCGALVRTCVEVLLGARPPGQMARWLTADLYSSLSHRAVAGRMQRSEARRVAILRVHTHEVDESHHEASVVFHDGRRVRAAAVRIENHRGRWRASALEIG